MKRRAQSVRVRHPWERRPVKIVSDAVVSTRGKAGGRFLPVLLLDTSERADIAELIETHGSNEPGDVKVQWGQIEGHDNTASVFLTFVRPIEVFAAIEFDIVREGILIDQALSGGGIYLTKAEDSQDRFPMNFNRPRILVEIPDTGYRKAWDTLFRKRLARHFRDKGLSRSDAKRAAVSWIEKVRKLGEFRTPDR